MTHHHFFDLPFFDDGHRRLAGEFGAWVDRELSGYKNVDENVDTLTTELVRKLGDAGWLKYCVPAAFGGAHEKIDSRSVCIQREILTHAFAVADAALSMQGIGSAGITFFGEPETQAAYLPKVVSGEAIAGLALTEAQSGSDVANTQSTARRDGDDFIIDGSKSWISNAGIGDYYITVVRTGEAPGAKGLSAFVVDADNPGLSVSEVTEIQAPHQVGCLEYKDCRVPASAMLGNPGDGFKVAMATLDEALVWIKQRKMFGQTLADFQNTQMRIADIAVDIDAAALLVYRAAWIKDCGTERPTRSASMAKLYATEAAGRVVDTALQFFGAVGIRRGETIERLYREARMARIFEGTSEIQRIIIGGDVIKSA